MPALCNLWHGHTHGHRPQGDCSCYVKKRVAFQIAQGESDAVRGYPVCMDQAALIFTVQEDEQSLPGKGESCIACVLHCWPFPARHGTHPSAKSCLSLSHNSGTSSAFVRSRWCEGSEFTAQWPPNLLALVLCLQSVQMLGCKSGPHHAKHRQVSLLLQRWDAAGKTPEGSMKS